MLAFTGVRAMLNLLMIVLHVALLQIATASVT